MDNLLTIWNGLDMRRRMILVGVTVGVFAAVLAMARVVNAPNMTLLYSGMEPGAAGQVIAALDARGVAHDIRGTAIYVPSDQRDQLRMSLASEGLPESTTAGYELLEQMTGFGTTSQMFDAAYWRAKEGELARTIAAAAGVKSARVHLARDSGTSFQRARQSSASVTLVMQSGVASAAQARAIQFLVGSAVPDLSAQDVAIIDAGSGQVISTDGAHAASASGEARQQALKQSVERILAARLGPGRAVVELSLETVTTEETILERRFDPGERVIVSSDTEERTHQSDGSDTAGVGVASNLPEGETGAGGSQSARDSETRERVNYDFSQTEREVRLAPGAIKRLTVAVLVDGLRTTDTQGESSYEPRTVEELAALDTLVKAAVGFDAERGDVISIQTMQFESVPDAVGTASSAPSMFAQFDINMIVKALLILAGLLVMAKLFLRPVLAAAAPMAALPAPSNDDSASSEINDFSRGLPELPALGALPALEGADGMAMPQMATIEDFEIPIENDNGMIALPKLAGMPPITSGSDEEEEEDPVERLKKLIEQRKEETVEILRGWMEEREEDA